PLRRLLHKGSVTCAELGEYRAGAGTGTLVLLLAGVSWVCQWMALVATFRLLGFDAPLDSLLFAFTASEVLEAIAPIPAGTGIVEGGLVGALALTGLPIGHAIVGVITFRVVCYWLVTGASALTLVGVSHGTRRLTGLGAPPDLAGQPGVPDVGRVPVAVALPSEVSSQMPAAVQVSATSASNGSGARAGAGPSTAVPR
ncbi:MAG: lysylphosphatidylglycerol synthase domain-containing protein, partial [Acidimicrobiales bacterium]